MKTILRLLAIALSLAAYFAVSGRASAKTYTINASDRGWYDSDGLHAPSNSNYLVGNWSGDSYRDFFVFSIPTLSSGEVITAAELQLFQPADGFFSGNASESYRIFKLEQSSIATLVAGTGGTTAYADLGSGTAFSNAVSITSASQGQTVVVPLNNTFIANAISGSTIAIGGAVTTLDSNPATEEFSFGSTGAINPTKLVLTTSFANVSFGLVNGGFETVEALGGGMPTNYGDWANEQASIVQAQNGITPYAGSRMLSFLGTGAAGGSTDETCAVVQFVSMSDYASVIDSGNGCRVIVTGRFNRIAATDSEFALELVGYTGVPGDLDTITTARSESFDSDENLATWEILTDYIDLPPGTRTVAVYVVARENITNNPSSPEFDGNYADDIRLSVQTDFTAPTLSPVTIASNNANTVWARLGNTVTLTFTANEPIQTPSVTLLGVAATVSNPSGNYWIATATVGASTAEGTAAFSITATDLAGNTAAAVTATTDGSSVTVDKTTPTLTPPGNIVTGATSVGGAVVSFTPGTADNLDPAPVTVANPASGSVFSIGVTTVNLALTDAAGNVSTGSFTVTVQNQTNVPNFTNVGTVPLTANGFDATGLSVGTPVLGFDPAPGQVLTLVNNTSANPIGGAFTDLPDGGTVLTSYGGRSLLFQSSYTGGDGNDITLTLLNPEIVVEQPALSDVPDGGARTMPLVVTGTTASLSFTIRNTGPGILNGLTITKDGADEALFTVTASPVGPVNGPAGSTTFTVEFSSATGGEKTAVLRIANDDANEAPFDITLTARAFSPNDDTDGDGLNDAAEFLLASLGYDWQVSQPALVATFLSNAALFTQGQVDANRQAGRADVTSNPNAFSLYTLSQVQALNVGVPLLAKDAMTGRFKLTIGIKKSTDLIDYDPFPFVSPGTTINAQGEVEFEFTVPDSAAFFRLEVR